MDSQRLPIPAILEQDIGAIKSFLTAGGKATINDCCYESERYGLCSALMVACENGKIEVVRLLLEEGAEVGLKSSSNLSALVIASEGGLFEIVKLLLVKVDDKCCDLLYALVEASKIGHCKIIELILSACAQRDLWFDKSLALSACVSNGYLDATQLLLNRGTNVNGTDDKGCTALMLASSKGDLKIVKLLLGRGAYVNNEPRNVGQAIGTVGPTTPLMLSSKAGHYEVTELLLRKGAQVDVCDEHGWCALMYACKGGHCAVARLLLDKGSKIDLQGTADNKSALRLRGRVCSLIFMRKF